MTDYRSYRGWRGTGLEMYLLNVFAISYVVLVVLNICISAMFVVSSGG